MPNIVAHNHISAQVYGPELTDFMLGSTLPDFQGMYNARYGESKGEVTLDGLLPMAAAGAKFHKRTDAVYDAQPEVPQITGPLREDMQSVGVPYKAARLTAAFAADILLDRALLECSGPRINFDNLRDASMRGEISVYSGMDVRLVQYIRGFLNNYSVTHYGDSRSVAMMAQKRLKSRKEFQKRISAKNVPKVEQVVEAHAERVGELGLTALGRTIQILGSDTKIVEASLDEQKIRK